jgi:hypothetical protein
VVNGGGVAEVLASRARQLSLFARLGIQAPRSRVIASGRATRGALDGLRAPLRVRSDATGRRAVRFESASAVGDAAARGELDFAPEPTVVVQELAPWRDESASRVELLGGDVIYAVRRNATTRDLVPFVPTHAIARAARQIAGAIGLDAGSVDYVVDDRDGEPYFTGIHARLNALSDSPGVVGFDPVATLADYLATRVATPTPAAVEEAFDRSG